MYHFFVVMFRPCPFPMLGLSCFELICFRTLCISSELLFCHVFQIYFSSSCFELSMVLFPCKASCFSLCLFLNIWRINGTLSSPVADPKMRFHVQVIY